MPRVTSAVPRKKRHKKILKQARGYFGASSRQYKSAKDAVEKWLLNKNKQLDVRIAITQAKLEELYEDPNIPTEFGTLILQINIALEKLLSESNG